MASKLSLINRETVIVDNKTLISKEDGLYRAYRLADTEVGYIASDLYDSIKGSDKLGLLKVRSKSLYGLMTKDLEVIVKPKYKSIKLFEDDFVALFDDSCGLFRLNKKQELDIVVPMIYSGLYTIVRVNRSYLALMLDNGLTQSMTVINEDGTVEKPDIDFRYINQVFSNGNVYFKDSQDILCMYNIYDNMTITDIDYIQEQCAEANTLYCIL